MTTETTGRVNYWGTPVECLEYAEILAQPNSTDAELVTTALARLRAYGDRVTTSPLSDITQGWLFPAVRAVATEARSVRVRREGLRAIEALIRAERASTGYTPEGATQ